MNIRDIRVGMWLVFGQEGKRDMTKDKAYQVLGTADEDHEAEGIVYVNDDKGKRRGLYARRFDREAQVPAVPAAHKFKVGDVVVGNDGRQWDIIRVLDNGNVFVRGPLPRGAEFKNFGNVGYEPDKFNLVDAPAAAPEAPQQAAVGAAVPAYVPKIGDRVRLLDGVGMPNAHMWWIERNMREMVGQEFEIANVHVNPDRVRFLNDENDYCYPVEWIDPVAVRPFAVGDLVVQKGFEDREPYMVLALLDDGKIRISEKRNNDRPLGTWGEDMFVLHKRGDGKAVPAKPAIIKLEVGNVVKVVKKTTGPRAKWIEEMDATIDRFYKIERHDEWANAFQLTNGYLYLRESLELAKEEDLAKQKKQKTPDLRSLIAQSRKEDIKNVGNVSSYIVFVRNKKTGEITLNKNLRDVCHARLAIHYGRHDDKEAVAVIDYQQEHLKQVIDRAGKEFVPTYKKFVDYIVNHSPWRVAFQGKAVKSILDNGVLMNVEAPSGAVAGACQALRFLSEFAGQNATWKLMMDNGIQADAAFLVTYAFTEEGGRYTQNAMGGGHQPINGSIAAGNLISFFANGYDEKFLKSSPYREQTSYRVHEHIEAVKDKLNIRGSYIAFVTKNIEWTEEKKGWADVQFTTEEQVLAFARKIEQLIIKARA